MSVLKHPLQGIKPVASEDASERIQAFLDQMCVPEGFDIAQIEGMAGFPMTYPRPRKGMAKLRFPEHVRFLNLVASVGVSEAGKVFDFTLGLARTPYDPKKGRVTNYWVHDNPTQAIFSNDVTGHASYQLRLFQEPHLRLKTLQSTAVLKEDQQAVMDELDSLPQPPNGGTLSARRKSHEEWCVPWAYQDRLMLFAPVTILLARKLGVKDVRVYPEITEESRPSVNYDRFIYIANKLPHEGISIQR